MSKLEKLLQKARNNPNGLSFKEFRTLMSQCGWKEDRQSGSHQIWFSPRHFRLCVQNRNGEAKAYQVKQFLQQYDEEQRYEH
ncbi:MAG: type II toxin-antitoxin system HicA family toxin [Pseudomonadota bacterium]